MTERDIVIGAYKMAGIPSPEEAQIQRGLTEGMERVKNDIWNRVTAGGDTRLKSLQKSAVLIGTIGQDRIPLPSDFNEEFMVCILDGTETGTATAGALSTITIDTGLSDVPGKNLAMTAGTSKGEYAKALTYTSATGVTTIMPEWNITPVNGDTYMLIDSVTTLKERNQTEAETVSATGKPTWFSKFADELYFDKPFDKAYPILLRYYAQMNQVTLTSKILIHWQAPLEQGLYARILKWLDDATYGMAKAEFDQMVMNMIYKELPYGGEEVKLVKG